MPLNTWGKKQKLTFLSDMNIGNDIAGFEYLKKGYENIWQKYFEYIKVYLINLQQFDFYLFQLVLLFAKQDMLK